MTVKSNVKAAARRLSDRIAAPYVDEIVRQQAPVQEAADAEQVSAVEPADVPSDFFHGILHELRTVELERSHGDYERIVSVGAQGRWYFDWIERSLGPVREHVGVEAFEPEPPDLPPYATWRPTTADRFDGVDDDSVDLVFAGQTTEHLWAEELAGFLLQARRVLRDQGLLVLDSPNRLVTEHLHWSHGGHTVELSAEEIAELVSLAGFTVESIRGAWRCRIGEQVLQLEDNLGDGSLLVRRIADGPDQPDDCFVWWLVARPSGEPNAAELTTRCVQLYDAHWSTRVCRGMWPGPGSEGPLVDGASTFESLPFMLRAGRLRIAMRLAMGATQSLTSAELELFLPGGHTVHRLTLSDAAVHDGEVVWTIDQAELMFALTLRLSVQSSSPVRIDMPLSIQEVEA
jgi:SAM-dependent methyltransferase